MKTNSFFPFFGLLLALLTFSSCAQYQVFKTDSRDVTSYKDDVYVYEDKDLEVYYDLWEEGGFMIFKVHNRTDQHVYLSLDDSQFIMNGDSFSYNNAELGNMATGVILDIPPKSGKQVNGFPVTFSWMRIKNNKRFQKFQQLNSPIKFSNVLTYSFDPQLTNKKTVDHGFWVSHIRKMKRSEFKEFKKLPVNKANKFYVRRQDAGNDGTIIVELSLAILESLFLLL
ncbi:MAG: hypothetical protein AAFP19_03520 [Bacteroidota bacterium]